MYEKRKIWLGVSSALLATTVASTEVEAKSDITVNAQFNAGISSVALLSAGEGGEGEGGEGEGGEGGANIDLAKDNAAYLAQLGLIRGHLWVGYKLYQEGHIDMAKTHMKHPEDELYAGMEPVFKARQVDGFAKELQVLADAVNGEKGDAAVKKAYQSLQNQIAKSERIEEKSARDVLISISLMVRTAADEYAIGVKNGDVVNVHEYQDAYGFTEIAIERLDSINSEQQQLAAKDIENTRQWLLELRDLWPTVDPQGKLEGDASHLYGAAARIELAAMNN
ncbi:hypothetical protein CW740_01165 [Kangiella profundi]|uniref:Uncharacterized protein n=1 Tax=Kangiella profundi TaxID=1561924 RepID=A0A2K9A5B4_9GAMM|nr:hypothetical protein [Kangiella profundi]AUD77920.1 hypothetical protein CW740_01165 [Kangiella profundi]GGE91423.1 hypothetical protein GCM10011356_01930 [Kangiella profundi]